VKTPIGHFSTVLLLVVSNESVLFLFFRCKLERKNHVMEE
jgi:hypothetical protein